VLSLMPRVEILRGFCGYDEVERGMKEDGDGDGKEMFWS
jgi:hypothetical protein